MRIGEAIRTFRELLGLTQEEFGKRLWSQEGKPVDRKTISNWENGKTTVSGFLPNEIYLWHLAFATDEGDASFGEFPCFFFYTKP